MDSSRVRIHVSCNKLKNKDKTSKSDPCCILYIKDDEEWTEVGRTETIKNSLDPRFVRPLEIDYEFEEEQNIRFELYDVDNTSEQLADDDFLGQLETTVAEVVAGSPYTKELMGKVADKLAGGTITLRVQEAGSAGKEEVLKMIFRAEKLDKKDAMGKSDPFLEISRKLDGDDWQVVVKTEVVKNNLNPTWQPIHVKAEELSGGDHNNPIKVDCKDYDSNGKHELIGSFLTSVAELMKESKGHRWPCINEQRRGKKKNYENSGIVVLEACDVDKE